MHEPINNMMRLVIRKILTLDYKLTDSLVCIQQSQLMHTDLTTMFKTDIKHSPKYMMELVSS